MTDNSKDGLHLIRAVCVASLFIAVGLVGSGFSNIWSANAQQTDQKTDMKMKPGTKMEMKPGTKMEMKPGTKMEMTTTGIFDGVGKIIALVPEQSQVVVGHEEIKGFMKAMPMGMGYAVESEDLLQGLEIGDRVKFKIDAAKKKIVAIEPVARKNQPSDY